MFSTLFWLCGSVCTTCTFSGRFFFSLVFALDEMGTRIDDLEKNVVELMTQAGMEEQASSK